MFLENRPFFGAMLVHIPFLHELRERHPGGRVVLFAPFAQACLLVGLGCADEARLYGRSVFGLLRELRALHPDTVHLLRAHSERLDLVVGLSGAAERIGFRSACGRLLFTRTVPHRTDTYRPRKYLGQLGDEKPGAPCETVPLDPWFRREAARSTFTGPGAYLAVLPGGGSADFKLWGIGNYLALCARVLLEMPDMHFLFVLGPKEAEYRAAVESSEIRGRARFLIDRPVPDLAAAAFGAVAAVGNDCGPDHIFQMCGCPFACVMSNHDGRAAERISEWIDGPNRRFALTTSPGESIGAVTVQAAVRTVLEMIQGG